MGGTKGQSVWLDAWFGPWVRHSSAIAYRQAGSFGSVCEVGRSVSRWFLARWATISPNLIHNSIFFKAYPVTCVPAQRVLLSLSRSQSNRSPQFLPLYHPFTKFLPSINRLVTGDRQHFLSLTWHPSTSIPPLSSIPVSRQFEPSRRRMFGVERQTYSHPVGQG